MRTYMWFVLVLSALSAAGKVIQTKPGQSVIIDCGVTTYMNLEWRREDFTICVIDEKTGSTRKGTGRDKGNIVTRVQVKRRLNLELSRVEEGDAGEFTCIVDGISHIHTLLVVSVSVSPSADLQLGSVATLQCQVKGLHPGSTVEWKKPDGSAAGSETFQLNPVASSDAGLWVCKFSHDGTEYTETLEVKVKEPAPHTDAPIPSANDVIKPSCRDCIADPSDPSSPGVLMLGLSWWMWATVAGGTLILTLLAVAVVILHKRNRRRKRRFLKKKKPMHLLTPRDFCQCKRPAAAAPPPQGRRREKPSAAPPLME